MIPHKISNVKTKKGEFRPPSYYSEMILIDLFSLPSGTILDIEIFNNPFFMDALSTMTSSARVNFLVNFRTAIPL